jgi:hypothetical protein
MCDGLCVWLCGKDAAVGMRGAPLPAAPAEQRDRHTGSQQPRRRVHTRTRRCHHTPHVRPPLPLLPSLPPPSLSSPPSPLCCRFACAGAGVDEDTHLSIFRHVPSLIESLSMSQAQWTATASAADMHLTQLQNHYKEREHTNKRTRKSSIL